MNLKLSKEQIEWLTMMTGTNTAQEAVDAFTKLMREEGCKTADIMVYINVMMRVQIPFGGK